MNVDGMRPVARGDIVRQGPFLRAPLQDHVVDPVGVELQIVDEEPAGDELEGVRGSLGLPVERDLYFQPTSLYELQKQHL
jgi:hypothetical protein